MLSQMRQNTKTILWIVIVAFIGLIFVVWGMNLRRSGGPAAGYVAKIAGKRVTVEEYRNEVVNQRAMYYQEQKGKRGTQAEYDIGERAWETMVQRHLLWGEIDKEGLAVTDEEVATEIQTNPPAFIRNHPAFQTDSVFDPQRYVAALSDPGFDFRPLESYMRSTLPIQKLEGYVVSGVRVTEPEVRLFLDLLDEQATISYVRVSPTTSVRAVIPEPSDAEIDAYFSSHSEDFRVAEKRKVGYVKFAKEPSAEDERYAREQIEEAYDLVSEGEPFEDIAAEYSEDERTAGTGGDLGWVRRGQLRRDLDSLAFILEPGKTSEIQRTKTGFYLLRVDETRTTDGVPEVRVRYIFVKLEPSPLTVEQVKQEASDFAAEARRHGLKESAAEASYDFAESPEATVEQLPMTLRIPKSAAEAIFNADAGQVVGPVEATDAFYVVDVAGVVPSGIPQATDIKANVAQAYVFSQKKQMARDMAAAMVAETSRGVSLEDAARKVGLEVEKAQPFTRTSSVPGIGKDNAVVAHAFSLEKSQTSGVIEHSNNFFVIRVDDRQFPAGPDYEKRLADARYSLLSTKQQAFLTDWYEGLKKDARIEDYRSLETAGRASSADVGYIGY